MHVEIQSFKLSKAKGGKSQIHMSILIKNMEHLKSVMAKISKINDVNFVKEGIARSITEAFSLFETDGTPVCHQAP